MQEQICINLLAYHLLSSPDAQAAVIDTSGSFDVLKLHNVLLQQCKKYELRSTDAKAEEALDRVRVMRVFDFVGVSESINEIKMEFDEAQDDDRLPWPPSPIRLYQKTAIADSEDEDEDDNEMVMEQPAKHRQPEQPALSEKVIASDKPWMIVVDNFAQVASPIVRSNYVQGQALLSTFLRSLSLLTTTRNICTVLINSATPYRISSLNTNIPRAAAPPPTPWAESAINKDLHADLPSIFASNLAKPALGKPFASFLDLHLMTSYMPKSKRDVQTLGSEGATPGFSGAAMVNVIEVLNSRHDGRAGRWATFTIERGADLKDDTT